MEEEGIKMNDEMFKKIHEVLDTCLSALQWSEEKRRGVSDYDWMNSVECISIYARELEELVEEIMKDTKERCKVFSMIKEEE